MGGGAREPSLWVFQIYLEFCILSFSYVFAGWTRYCYCCIAVYFKLLASKALHCTLYHAEHFFAISAMDVHSSAPIEHVQLSKVKYPKTKVAHRAWLSVELNMHPNKQFRVFLRFICPHVCMFCFVSRMSLFVSRCVPSGGGGGGRGNRHFGYAPPGM